MNRNAPKKKLIHNAVPTLFDVPNPPPRLTPLTDEPVEGMYLNSINWT